MRPAVAGLATSTTAAVHPAADEVGEVAVYTILFPGFGPDAEDLAGLQAVQQAVAAEAAPRV